jgi:hypothetical protein
VTDENSVRDEAPFGSCEFPTAAPVQTLKLMSPSTPERAARARAAAETLANPTWLLLTIEALLGEVVELGFMLPNSPITNSRHGSPKKRFPLRFPGSLTLIPNANSFVAPAFDLTIHDVARDPVTRAVSRNAEQPTESSELHELFRSLS